MSRTTLGLDARAALRVRTAGGKGARLARLRREGFQVPEGFVVTTDALRGILATGRAFLLETDTRPDRATVGALQAKLLAMPVEPRLRASVLRAYHRLGGPVAVRSSLVGEDGPQTSFAGQLDTILNVTGAEEVLSALRRCCASLFNYRLIHYVREAGVDAGAEDLGLAVVVQRMVPPRLAGVAFSADPLTGERCVIVEGAPGEGVVRGKGAPARYRIDARGAVTREAGGEGSEEVALTEPDICTLGAVVRRVADHFGQPQDVEWVWDGRAFHILQSRPISTLVGRHVYSRALLADMSPGVIRPLVWSTHTLGMATNVFGRLFTTLLGETGQDYRRLVRRIHSRIYADTTALGALLTRIGLPANFFEAMAHGERSARPSWRRVPPMVLLRLAAHVWRYGRGESSLRALAARRDAQLVALRRADWSERDPAVLMERGEALIRLHGETQWAIFRTSINMIVRNRLLTRVVRRHAPQVVAGDLIRGLRDLKALEPTREIARLGSLAHDLPESELARFATEEPAAIRLRLAHSPEGQRLAEEVDGFLARFGFLSADGTDFASPSWAEQPAPVWRAVARAAVEPAAAGETAAAAPARAASQARGELPWYLRAFFSRLLAGTHTYIALRERISLLMSEESYQLRRIFLALGGQMKSRGALEAADDVFDLQIDEVRRWVSLPSAGDGLRERIARRQIALAADRERSLPVTICGDHVPDAPLTPSGGMLQGVAGSRGLAQGRARIVLDPDHAPSLSREDILIVPFTDIGWTPLLGGVGGIVAESGGQLSHTAIIAREYGLPAVVGVREATRRISEGQRLVLDGARGRVYLVPDPSLPAPSSFPPPSTPPSPSPSPEG